MGFFEFLEILPLKFTRAVVGLLGFEEILGFLSWWRLTLVSRWFSLFAVGLYTIFSGLLGTFAPLAALCGSLGSLWLKRFP